MDAAPVYYNLSPYDSDETSFHEVYVGNLPSDCTPHQLRNVFEKFGEIVNISPIKRSKNYYFAFVTFYEATGAQRAVREKFVDFHRRRLKISRAHYQLRSNMRSIGNNTPDNNLVDYSNTSNEETVYEYSADSSSINSLNDDCLLHIFEMLDLNVRLSIERVCKRWGRLCNHLWSKQHSLCMNMISWTSWDYVLTTQFLRSLLLRCGNSLTHLDLSGKTCTLNSRTLQMVAHSCPGLKKLNISGLQITPHGAKALARHCHLIQELHMESCNGLRDGTAQIIFDANKSLKVLNLAKNCEIKGSCLKTLSLSLKELSLASCISLKSVALVPHLKRLHNLISLNLDCCTSVGNNTLTDIVAAVPNLQHLSCSNYMPALTYIGLNSIHNLKHLKSLNLVMSTSVCDETLRLISRGCSALYSLDISCCGDRESTQNHFTEEGIKYLANLPNLRLLTMSYNSIVTDEALEHLATSHHLEQLQCRGCPCLSDVGCKAVIQHCQKLVDLDVSGCELVTNSTILTAIEEINKRSKDEKLFLTLGGTGVEFDKLPDLPSNLIVNLTDLCVKHLRPDFYDHLFTSDDEIDEMDDWYNSDDDEDDEDLFDIDSMDDVESYDFYLNQEYYNIPFFLF